MRLVALIVIFILMMGVILPNVYALTRAEKERQLQQRQDALDSKTNKTSVIKLSKYNMIAIELSRTCLRLVKSNSMNDGCYRYSALEPLDTTDKKYSGSFFYDNGFYHRGKPLLNNHEIVYRDVNATVVCVDCPGKILNKIPNIIVEPRNFVYKLGSDVKILNNTRYEYHDRYVENCFTARVSSDMDLIVDTINYLKSGCKQTSFKEQKTIVKPYSKLSYDGPAYQYAKWLLEAKKLKGINCLKSNLC